MGRRTGSGSPYREHRSRDDRRGDRKRLDRRDSRSLDRDSRRPGVRRDRSDSRARDRSLREKRERSNGNASRQSDVALPRKSTGQHDEDAGAGNAPGVQQQGESDAIKPIWTCKSCGASMFGHITQCTRCGKMKPEADLRFVQVWNIPPDVLKKPLQWFVKKAGGSSANMAPVGAQLVMVKSPTANADVQTAVLEAKSIPEAEALVGAIEKWKVGIPKMKAKVISEEDFENLLEKSTTCVVFVKNVPEDIEDESDIKNMGKDIERAQIGHHPQHGRYAIIQARSHGAARSCVDVNIPHSSGVMTAELMTVYQQEMVLKGSSQSASRKRNGQRRSRSRRR